MTIAENIAAIRAKIANAAQKSGRKAEEIMLVGASKMNDANACREAIAAGIDALGENRVQEMTQKLAQDAYRGAPLHFIGALQRNKVKQVVGKVDLIESVSSIALLDCIEKHAAVADLTQDILLEVNIGGEEAKSGFAPDILHDAVRYTAKLPHIRLRGLMCIPPIEDTPHENIPYFEKMRTLFVDISANLYDNRLDILSMGMSADFEDAVLCGATAVRVGTAIFGKRNYDKGE